MNPYRFSMGSMESQLSLIFFFIASASWISKSTMSSFLKATTRLRDPAAINSTAFTPMRVAIIRSRTLGEPPRCR